MPAHPFFRRAFGLAFLLGALPFASSQAAETRRVSVEATCFPAATTVPCLSYRIVRPNANSTAERADAADIRHVRTALSGRGLFEAPPGVAPDLLVEIRSGIDEPHIETRRRSVAVAPPHPFDPPSPSIDYTFVDERIAVATKFLVITARSAATSANVWRVHAAISDEGIDLEPYLPVLAAAVMNVVGSDTRGTTTLKLSTKDADVAFIQLGLAATP